MKPYAENIRCEYIPDMDADTSYLEQEGWEDRLEAYRNGTFNFIGIRATCDIIMPTEQGGYLHIGTMKSPGLWSIEDDSARAYMQGIEYDEVDQLLDILAESGIEAKR